MSVTRATTGASPLASARRSAFETTVSSTLIGRRWLTPDRLSIFRSARAWKAISSITSRTNRGTSTLPPRATQASCSVMVIASARLCM